MIERLPPELEARLALLGIELKQHGADGGVVVDLVRADYLMSGRRQSLHWRLASFFRPNGTMSSWRHPLGTDESLAVGIERVVDDLLESGEI